MKRTFTPKHGLILALIVGILLGTWSWFSHRETQHQGKTATEWTQDLKITQISQSNTSLDALLEIGPQSIPALQKKLNAQDGPLQKGYTKLRDQLPENLRSQLEAPVPQNLRHAYAAWALGEIGPAARDAVPDLLRALASPDPVVRSDIVKSLRKIDQRTPEVISALIKIAQDPNPDIKEAAIWTLQWMAPESAPAAPVFQQLLTDPVQARLAASGLGTLGPAASNAIPALILLMNTGTNLPASALQKPAGPPGFYVPPNLPAMNSSMAALSLGNVGIDSPEVLAALRAAASTDSVVKTNALASLEKLTLKGVPPLVDKILKANPEDEAALMPLLVELDANGRARHYLMTNAALVRHLVPLLVKRLEVPEPYSYVHFTELLQALQPDHPLVMPMIKKSMADDFLPSRINGTIMYWKATGDAGPALKILQEGLAAPPSGLSQTFPQWLARLGPAAKPAVPTLVKALWHPDEFTRPNAAKALKIIDPEALEKALKTKP